MNVGQTLLTVGASIGLASASAVALIALAQFRRGVVAARSKAVLAPYRLALITVAAGEDEGGEAKAELCAVPAATWARLRPGVVAFLPKVRGLPADELSEVMRAHGEIDDAMRMLSSRSAVRRARAAYLLGLVRGPRSAALVLPLLSDPVEDVRLAAVQALGAIGDPSAAGGVLGALRNHRGQIVVPAWSATEALLSMGIDIGPALQIGLASKDPAVRNVCALVAGQGAFLSAAPQLRVLLATGSDGDVRVSAAMALGRVGGVDDAASLVRHTDSSEPSLLRQTCAVALGDLGQRGSLEALAGLLADDDRRLAGLAADSLIRIGSEGIEVLVMAATRQGPSARAAGGALQLARLREPLAAIARGS